MVELVISSVLGNFSLVMLIAAIVVAVALHYGGRKTGKRSLAEELFRWVALLAVSLPGLFTFVMHVFFAETTAEHIGWQTSPFQFEVGMADLAIGVLGVVAFYPSMGFRVATVLATVCWLGGDAVGHIRQMVIAHNFAPGNAGSWFWTDVLVPLLMVALVGLLWRQRLGLGAALATGQPASGKQSAF